MYQAITEIPEKQTWIVSILPNPNNGQFVINGNLSQMLVKIYDSVGRLVKNENGKFINIEIPEVYFIQI
jgi:hypothetical protein